MIQLARAVVQGKGGCTAPDGCSYLVADAAQLPQQAPHLAGSADVALCAYLFNYARSYVDLLAMARGVYGCLRPGGRCVGINDNPHTPYDASLVEEFAVGRQLEGGSGMAASGPGTQAGGTGSASSGRGEQGHQQQQPADGTPLRILLRNNDGREFSFHNYFFAPATYERAFAEAGFVGYRWVPCVLKPEASEEERARWQRFLAVCPMIGFEARRPAQAQ
jgi:hypothetical protein